MQRKSYYCFGRLILLWSFTAPV